MSECRNEARDLSVRNKQGFVLKVYDACNNGTMPERHVAMECEISSNLHGQRSSKHLRTTNNEWRHHAVASLTITNNVQLTFPQSPAWAAWLAKTMEQRICLPALCNHDDGPPALLQTFCKSIEVFEAICLQIQRGVGNLGNMDCQQQMLLVKQ